MGTTSIVRLRQGCRQCCIRLLSWAHAGSGWKHGLLVSWLRTPSPRWKSKADDTSYKRQQRKPRSWHNLFENEPHEPSETTWLL